MDMAMEKFSELIVRDVVNTVMRTQSVSPDFEWTILNNYDLVLDPSPLEDQPSPQA
jgi:hypothetical protein